MDKLIKVTKYMDDHELKSLDDLHKHVLKYCTGLTIHEINAAGRLTCGEWLGII